MSKIIYYIDPNCGYGVTELKENANLFQKCIDDGVVHLYGSIDDFIAAFNNGFISDEGFILTTEDDGVKFYAVVKAEFTDDEQTIRVLAVSDDRDAALNRFNELVESELAFEQTNGVEYDTIDSTESSFEAYNMGYKMDSFVSIFIDEAPKA